jgi:hypothetical protein
VLDAVEKCLGSCLIEVVRQPERRQDLEGRAGRIFIILLDRLEGWGDENAHIFDVQRADVHIRLSVLIDLLFESLKDSLSRCIELPLVLVRSDLIHHIVDVCFEGPNAFAQEVVGWVVDLEAARGGLACNGVDVRHDVADLDQVEEVKGEVLELIELEAVAVGKMSLKICLPLLCRLTCGCLGHRQLCLLEKLLLVALLLARAVLCLWHAVDVLF